MLCVNACYKNLIYTPQAMQELQELYKKSDTIFGKIYFNFK